MGQCNEGVAPMVEDEAGSPVLTYFPFAGRGEVSRVCAAAGGLLIEEKSLMPGDNSAVAKAHGGVGNGLPVLSHGALKMCQSTAIANYICAIAPKFKSMPARCRGIDAMYFAHMEDTVTELGQSGIYGELFGGPKCDAAKLGEILDKWMSHFESMIPASGFINGQSFPTGADCVIFVFFKAVAPYSVFFAKGNISKDKYPKCQGLANRVAADPGVAAYMAKTASLTMNPFG